jgi:hypothetical protein
MVKRANPSEMRDEKERPVLVGQTKVADQILN